MDKLCPFMRVGNSPAWCTKDCALWSDKGCVLWVIANHLARLAGLMEEEQKGEN